jgi:cytochrome c-type biogenesis protein
MSLSLLTIFGAGLLTFASPCVLPLMPIYLFTIAGSALDRARPGRTLGVAAAFTSGFTLVFVALGALASSLGTLLIAYQRPITLFSGALMIAFGLRGLGLLRLAAFDRDARPGLSRVRTASGPAGAFVFGAAFALGWSPCIGPVLASVLTYAAIHSASPWRGAGYLAVYAAGLALPMLLLAAVAPHALQLVRRVRLALPLLEKATGAALLGIGVWTLATLATPASPAQPVISADQHPTSPANAACDSSEPGHTCALPELPAAELAAVPEDSALGQGPHLLEFGSHDCPVCRRMRPVLDRLLAACTELDGRVVRVDVGTASGRALAAQHGVRGTPTYVLVDRNGVEHGRLLGETTSAEIAAAIERAFGLSCWG